MELKKVDIKLWHPNCWSIETTRNHPDVTLVTNKAFKIGDEIRANFRLIAENYEALKKYIEETKKFESLALDVLIVGKSNLEAYIHGRFKAASTFYEKIFSLEMMPSTIIIHNGNEYWSIFVYDSKLRETLEKLSQIENIEYEILGIGNVKAFEEMPADVIEEISSSLSAKQKKVLVEAYRSGYFEYPRRVNLNDLAKKLGLAKSTCLHHIRLSEQKILKRIIEEIKDREPHISDF
ncbi:MULTISPECIES: helix-turn-helix domain-containing protein [unclassified Archaeoglobus]|mgnify:CR=1 FL=1|jgi:hypothetical protein|uniref:helix-turn-helix domain-containing protein n=1 Tax=unclassified Archaeoglobus TaxID=2643606 RepID=UPI0025BE7C1B|nr:MULTISPECIES: helix-turn-helix domain-containing protein [unclassified Archaeoglobus]